MTSTPHDHDFEAAYFAAARDLPSRAAESQGFTCLESFESKEPAICVGRYLMRRGIRCFLTDESLGSRCSVMVPADQIEQVSTLLRLGGDPDGFTTVETFDYDEDARAAKSHLELEGGIGSFLLPPLPSRHAPREYSLVVPNHRVEAARPILREHRRQSLLNEVSPPEPEIATDPLSRAFSLALVSVFFPPIIYWVIRNVIRAISQRRADKKSLDWYDKMILAWIIIQVTFAIAVWFAFLYHPESVPRTRRLFRI